MHHTNPCPRTPHQTAPRRAALTAARRTHGRTPRRQAHAGQARAPRRTAQRPGAHTSIQAGTRPRTWRWPAETAIMSEARCRGAPCPWARDALTCAYAWAHQRARRRARGGGGGASARMSRCVHQSSRRVGRPFSLCTRASRPRRSCQCNPPWGIAVSAHSHAPSQARVRARARGNQKDQTPEFPHTDGERPTECVLEWVPTCRRGCV